MLVLIIPLLVELLHKQGSTISCCETRVNVYAMVSGGITAEAHGSEIVNCSSVGTIDSFTKAGGITAFAMESNIKKSNIKNCFYAGAVTTSLQGSVIPIADCETISNCYYDKNQFSGQTKLLSGVTAKTTKQFQSGSVASGWTGSGSLGTGNWCGSVPEDSWEESLSFWK